jgi:hypothetical protein
VRLLKVIPILITVLGMDRSQNQGQIAHKLLVDREKMIKFQHYFNLFSLFS